MSQKRMFDRAIIDTDRFMDLPMTAKAIYFLLGMEADDEGFVSYKKVLRIHGGNEDDINVLIVKKFLIKFPTGVVVITDWNKNNWLDSRRMRPTEYQNEKKSLLLTGDGKYELSNGLASIEENRIEEYVVHSNENEKPTNDVLFENFWKEFPNKKNKKEAHMEWNRLNLTKELYEKIMQALKSQKDTRQWQN